MKAQQKAQQKAQRKAQRLRAYHGNADIKHDILEQLRAHVAAGAFYMLMADKLLELLRAAK